MGTDDIKKFYEIMEKYEINEEDAQFLKELIQKDKDLYNITI